MSVSKQAKRLVLVLALAISPFVHADDRLAIARSEALAQSAIISTNRHTQDVVLEISTMTLSQLPWRPLQNPPPWPGSKSSS